MKRYVAWLAWSMLALSLALFVAGTALLALTPVSLWERRSLVWPVDLFNLSLLTYPAVGALIASRRPRNPIGWIFCAMGLTWEIYGCATAYASYLALVVPASFHADVPLLVLPTNMWLVSFSLVPFLLFLFPNGQLLSRRWRPVVWLLALIIGIGYVTTESGFRAGMLLVQYPAPLDLLGIGTGSAVLHELSQAAQAGIMLAYILGGIAIVLRLRRARDDERQQLKWFVYAGTFLVVGVFVTTVFFDALHPLDPEALYSADLFFGIPYALAAPIIPAATGIAILKYRLYDIDLIIRRTLIYSVLTGTLALVYFGSVVLLQQLFRALTGEALQTEVPTVVSTLAIAALFAPLRRHIQNVIDRRFYRRKYDAAKTLAAFGATMRDEVDLNKLTERLVQVVEETMQPAYVSLWLKDSNATPAAARGQATLRREGAKGK